MKYYSINSQKGATLYFAIIIMSILLASVFTVSSVVLLQIKTIRGAGDAIVAFYAADTGAETALSDLYKGNMPPGGVYPATVIDNNASYEVQVTQPTGGTIPNVPESGDCQVDYYCIKSTGTYRGTKRAVEVKR
jgi:hypothetical protein